MISSIWCYHSRSLEYCSSEVELCGYRPTRTRPVRRVGYSFYGYRPGTVRPSPYGYGYSGYTCTYKHFGRPLLLLSSSHILLRFYSDPLCSVLLIPRLQDTTGCQTGLYNRFDNRLYTRYSQFSKRLSNRFDNRFDNRLYRVNGALQRLSVRRDSTT